MAGERIALELAPLDTLFFRDGRSFSAGRAVSGLPAPQTLMGSVRTRLLSLFDADLAALGRSIRAGARLEDAIRESGAPDWIARVAVRGPWLAEGGSSPRLWLDAPRHLRPGPNGSWVAASPRRESLPGYESSDGLLPLWNGHARRDKKAEMGYLDSRALAGCLKGEDLPACAIRAAGSLFAYDDKIGIAVNPATFVAADEMIYSVRMLSLAPGIRLYAEVIAPEGSGIAAMFPPRTPMALGGEGRYVSASPVTPVAWPEANGSARKLLILASPAPFAAGWKPDVLPDPARMVAAAVDGPFAVSGWDMARGGPKPTRFGAHAGSAYFLETTGPAVMPESLCEAAEDAQQGYGYYLKGTWNYA